MKRAKIEISMYLETWTIAKWNKNNKCGYRLELRRTCQTERTTGFISFSSNLIDIYGKHNTHTQHDYRWVAIRWHDDPLPTVKKSALPDSGSQWRHSLEGRRKRSFRSRRWNEFPYHHWNIERTVDSRSEKFAVGWKVIRRRSFTMGRP